MIAGFFVLLLAIFLLRRWIHHAQLELVPVIVPQSMAGADILAPPSHAIAARMVRDVVDVLAPPQRLRYAVLTFDDGPYPVTTPLLLAELRRLNVPADFFFIGRDAIAQPAIAARVAANGHEIGNHTMSHPQMKTLLFPAQLEEVVDGARAIQRIVGRPVIYFRAPHGNFDASTIEAARAQSETPVFWDVDPGDWKQVAPQFIIDNVTAHAKSPAVILLHNGSEATIEALPSIVDAYRRAGYQFVTLSELQRLLPLDQINDPIEVRLPARVADRGSTR